MRDVDWRMCLRCMSEGEDGQPMVAPTNASEVQRKMDGLNPLRRCAPNACGHSGARPLDAIKGSLSGGQSRPPLQPSPVSLCRKEILKKFLRDCNLDILWYTVRE